MRFYTNVYLHKNEILLAGYESGKKVLHKIPYKPYLFMNSRTGNTDYKTLKGTPVDRIDFDSVYEARDFVKRYKDVSGISIYGLTNYVYTFIRDHYPEMEIQYDPSLISVVSIDIEVFSGNGFPSVERASDEVLA
ncbi:DNA polymerase, partial [bacterium]|nr:DNA polymerase [bacterium]